MELDFIKMQGIGNDFIMLDDRDGRIESYTGYPDLAKNSVIADSGSAGTALFLSYRQMTMISDSGIINSDGSEPQMCGNGMRCFARYLYEHKIVAKRVIRVQTNAGTIIPEVMTNEDDRIISVKVDMGEPILQTDQIPFISDQDVALMEEIEVDGRVVKVTAVSMGNPHAVVFVDDVDTVDLEKSVRRLSATNGFPEKTNVEFIQVVSRTELKMRVWERGAGITLACGTGACASLVAAHLNQLVADKVLIHLAGGDLDIEWDRSSNHIYKTGPADIAFTGRVLV